MISTKIPPRVVELYEWISGALNEKQCPVRFDLRRAITADFSNYSTESLMCSVPLQHDNPPPSLLRVVSYLLEGVQDHAVPGVSTSFAVLACVANDEAPFCIYAIKAEAPKEKTLFADLVELDVPTGHLTDIIEQPCGCIGQVIIHDASYVRDEKPEVLVGLMVLECADCGASWVPVGNFELASWSEEVLK